MTPVSRLFLVICASAMPISLASCNGQSSVSKDDLDTAYRLCVKTNGGPTFAIHDATRESIAQQASGNSNKREIIEDVYASEKKRATDFALRHMTECMGENSVSNSVSIDCEYFIECERLVFSKYDKDSGL